MSKFHLDAKIIESLYDGSKRSFASIVSLLGLDPKTDFQYVNLSKLSFDGVDVSKYNFTGSNLRNTDFRNARGVEYAIFDDADLRGACGLDTVKSAVGEFVDTTSHAGVDLFGWHTLISKKNQSSANIISSYRIEYMYIEKNKSRAVFFIQRDHQDTLVAVQCRFSRGDFNQMFIISQNNRYPLSIVWVFEKINGEKEKDIDFLGSAILTSVNYNTKRPEARESIVLRRRDLHFFHERLYEVAFQRKLNSKFDESLVQIIMDGKLDKHFNRHGENRIFI